METQPRLVGHDPNDFVDDYGAALLGGSAAVFVGAGMSASAGSVDWVGLLRPIAERLGLDAERECDQLVAIAQYHVNANGADRSELHRRLIQECPIRPEPAENHRLLARLPFATYWTTNYDRLIERALEQAGRRVDVRSSVAHLARPCEADSALVVKMHGDVGCLDETVLTKDDYERYPYERAAFIEALTRDLASNVFLFIGLSFRDPNLDYVLARVRLQLRGSGRRHYCILRRESLAESGSDDEFTYRATWQRLAVEDLHRFAIHAVMVDEFDEITALLERLDRVCRSGRAASGASGVPP